MNNPRDEQNVKCTSITQERNKMYHQETKKCINQEANKMYQPRDEQNTTPRDEQNVKCITQETKFFLNV